MEKVIFKTISKKAICRGSVVFVGSNNITGIKSTVGYVDGNLFITPDNQSYRAFPDIKKDNIPEGIVAFYGDSYFPNDNNEINIFEAKRIMQELEEKRRRDSDYIGFSDTYEGECEMTWNKSTEYSGKTRR